MATTVISGRVDTLVARQAQIAIQRAGTTPGEVIKSVWENIAQTGEVPRREEEQKRTARQRAALERLDAIRAELSGCEWLHDLTDEQMKEMLGDRNA